MLYYKPLPGEDMAKAEVVAPVATKLVIFEGQPEAGKFVEHVTFKGLTFQHQEHVLPATGYAPYQAAFATEAAVMLDGARNVTIQDCEIGHVGGTRRVVPPGLPELPRRAVLSARSRRRRRPHRRGPDPAG